MLIARYTDRIDVAWGRIERVVTAHPINKKYQHMEYDFYRENEDGNVSCRNLYSSSMCGYRIAFPGTTDYSGYMRMDKCIEEDWRLLDSRIKCFPSHSLTEAERNQFIQNYPEFRYVLNKWHGTAAQTLQVLNIWKKFPEIELLLAGGYESIAFNNNFWRLTEKKRREIALWLRTHPKVDYSLSDIQMRIKYKLNDEEWKDYVSWNNHHYGANVSYELYKYLLKQEEKAGPTPWIKETYSDYKKSFSSDYCTHNFREEYWRYPKDLFAMHQRINDEINEAIALERQQEAEKRKKDERNVYSRLGRVAKKFSRFNAEIDGYSIFTTSSMKEWNLQAKTLHQCIVASGYYKGMSRKEYLIVFIRKDNQPVATAQIFKDRRIGQFYADEHGGPNNSRPTEEVQQIFNKWVAGLPPVLWETK